MARIRTLKPEILEDAKTAGLSDPAFRLFVSAICLADDFGNLQGDERWLASQIWWAHDDRPGIAGLLLELHAASLVSVYECRGQRYLHLRGWSKHQRIDNAGKPRVPKMDDVDAQEIVSDAPMPDQVRGDSRRNSASRGDSPLDPDPDQDHDRDPDLDGRAKEGAPSKAARARRRVRLSEDWEPSDAAKAKALELGVDVVLQAEKFRNHHIGKGTVFADVNASFRNWLLNAAQWAKERSPPRGNAHPNAPQGLSSDDLGQLAENLRLRGM